MLLSGKSNGCESGKIFGGVHVRKRAEKGDKEIELYLLYGVVP